MEKAQLGFRWPEDAAALAEHVQDEWIEVRGQPDDGVSLGCKWCNGEVFRGAPRHFPHEEDCIVVIANKIAREYYEDFNAKQKRQGKTVYSEPRS